MEKHKKKMVAPIIISILLLLYFGGFAAICAYMPDMPMFMKLLFGIIPILLGGVCIYVLVERIKEIRSGEEDDLSKY